MATYKIPELLSVLSDILNDGYPTVDIDRIDYDDECPECLTFSVLDESECIEYDPVDSIDPSSDEDMTFSFYPDDLCTHLFFTYKEIDAIHVALRNVLDYIKQELKNSEYSKEDIAHMKSDAICFRNLNAKLDQFFKNISPKNI